MSRLLFSSSLPVLIFLTLMASARAESPSAPMIAAPIEAVVPADTSDQPGPSIPEPLRPWVDWVLEAGPAGQDRRACPLDPVEGKRLCAWPGRLHLDLTPEGGQFSQAWQVFAETWVSLPGQADAWPQQVQNEGRPRPVVLHHGRPGVKLAAGRHLLTGRFYWKQRPDALAVPPATGLLSLVLDGRLRSSPRLEGGGQLWLRDADESRPEEGGDRLRLEVYRRIEDALPLRVLTRLELDVSGGAREVALGPVPLAGGIPLRIQSPLPSRLEANGRLRLQVRPGRWVVIVEAYHSGSVTQLSRPDLLVPWPEQEVWAFAARPDLRQVELMGFQSIDPRQTRIPADWARLPLYLAGPGEALRIVEQRRGDSDPGPDRLELFRDLWLDFDGRGYSLQDRIDGELRRTWRLEAGPGLDLGRVQVAGKAVLINRLDAESAPGVEVRRGRLDLVADGRLETGPEQVPASGWAMGLEAARSRLHLPPGWDLLAVSGVDNLPDTWLLRWTLLDLFLVLVIALGVGRLWGWGWGLLALVALGLTWQSPGAPRLVWLHLLAATAMLRLLPGAAQAGLARLRGLLVWYLRLSLLALLLVGLPFLVSEVRNGLYPQLERFDWSGSSRGPGLTLGGALNEARLASEPAAIPQSAPHEAESEAKLDGLKDSLQAQLAPRQRQLDLLDPAALVQTGPGIPDWRWRRFELVWTGPLTGDEEARMWLLTPIWSLVLSLLGALLLVLLGLRLGGPMPRRGQVGVGVALLLSLGIGAGLGPAPAQAGELPTTELLEDLRGRLLEPPDCLPHCLELPSLVLLVAPERLTLELTLDAAVPVAAPVPGGTGGWSPSEAQLNGVPLDLMGRDSEGRLLVPLTAGRHRLVLVGPLPARDRVDIHLNLVPRQVETRAVGWRVEGLDTDGPPTAQIQLVRSSPRAEAVAEPLVQDALPPLLRVDRWLRIGIDWRLETRVRRLSSERYPLLLPVPLLSGESVQTPGVQVEANRVLAALAPGVTELAWVSSLLPASELRLTASADSRLSEAWHLDLGHLWHLEFDGIPPVHHLGRSERWLPTWRPLPGETLVLEMTRPAGVPGSTLTIDRVDYRVQPGRRGADVELILALRSSQGGNHRLRLPPGAQPIRLSADGQTLPLPSSETRIELPLIPGSQRIELAWREPGPLRLGFTPSVPDLGSTAVNLNLTLSLPDDRWVLFAVGPGMGPAVLFWAVLLVLAGLAVALARSRLTPLRTHDWFLLGVGLSLAQIWVVLLVTGWLFALGLRRRLNEHTRAWRFNLVQIGLVLLTLAALAALIGAVQQGLLGRPEMQIMGNGSSGTLLNWYQDRGGPRLPEVWVLSVPMWVYRALMLAWALWLSFRLLDWLRWGWEGFVRPVPWRERRAADPGGRSAGVDGKDSIQKAR